MHLHIEVEPSPTPNTIDLLTFDQHRSQTPRVLLCSSSSGARLCAMPMVPILSSHVDRKRAMIPKYSCQRSRLSSLRSLIAIQRLLFVAERTASFSHTVPIAVSHRTPHRTVSSGSSSRMHRDTFSLPSFCFFWPT